VLAEAMRASERVSSSRMDGSSMEEVYFSRGTTGDRRLSSLVMEGNRVGVMGRYYGGNAGRR